jgi:hypothetical protein
MRFLGVADCSPMDTAGALHPPRTGLNIYTPRSLAHKVIPPYFSLFLLFSWVVGASKSGLVAAIVQTQRFAPTFSSAAEAAKREAESARAACSQLAQPPIAASACSEKAQG